MALTKIARLLPWLALHRFARLIFPSQPALPSALSQPFKRDISTLQYRGHFYFALTRNSLKSTAASARRKGYVKVNYQVWGESGGRRLERVFSSMANSK